MLETTARPGPAPAPPEVRTYRAGSFADAKDLRRRIQELLAAIDRADLRLQTLCETARLQRIYLLLEAPTGGYFTSWTDFCVAPQPWGLGLAQGMIDELVKEHADPRRRARLALEAPLALRERGGQPGHAPTHGDRAGTGTRALAPGRAGQPGGARERPPRLHGGEYVLQRLRRDFPELLAQVASGELPNIKAAALAAGLSRPMLTCRAEPMAVARMVVTRFDPAERQEIVDLLTHPETIIGPGGRDTVAWKRYREATTPPEVLEREWAEKRAAAAARQRERAVAVRRNRRARGGIRTASTPGYVFGRSLRRPWSRRGAMLHPGREARR